MPAWVMSACDEYLKRINHGKYSCKIIEIKADKMQAKSAVENMLSEAKKIKAQIPSGSFVIVLDEKGQNFDSVKFASRMEAIALHNANITFIIGGADGIHPTLKQEANLQLQLSSLTFPHALVRVIILEQLDTKLLSQILQKKVYPFIMRLDKQEAHGFVREWAIVSMPPQRHLAYALQWFAMALVILIIFVALNLKKKNEEYL
jgi:rRNA large subunit m3Psi methyltransferase RlmH